MYQELKRTLSSSNLDAAEQVHNFIKFQQEVLKDKIPVLTRDVTKSSLIFPERYKESSLRQCVDNISLTYLEENCVLNWCDGCRLLVPLRVNDDGNSLMHALSVYMFGVQDKRYVLRQLLYQRLFMEGAKGVLRQRWMMKISSRSTISWNHIVEMASEKKLTNLYDIHVFTMSNILGRPIIVISDQSNERNEENSMPGIYLPFLRDPSECEKSPIILGYIKGLFLPLVSSDSVEIPLSSKVTLPDAMHCIPLIDYQGSELQVKFLLPKEEVNNMQIKIAFLDDVRISDSQKGVIPAAMLKFKTPPAHTIELMWSLDQACQVKENAYTGLLNEDASSLVNSTYNAGVDPELDTDNNYQSLLPCANGNQGCPNNVSSNNNQNLCTHCYNTFLSKRELCSRKIYGCTKKAGNNVHNLCNDCYESCLKSNSVRTKSQDVTTQQKIDKCRELSCPEKGYPQLQDLCQKCFFIKSSTEQENQNKNYDVLNNFKNDENRLSGAQYDRLDLDSMIKNRPLPAVPNDSNVADPENDKSIITESSDPSSLTGAGNNAVRSDFSNSSIRKKVLCATAGCINSIGADNMYCNDCSINNNDNIRSMNRQECLMDGCTNTAEANDNFLCMICLQSQRDIVRENEAFDVRSLVHSLPPVKIPENINEQQARFNSNIPPIPNIPNIPNIPLPPRNQQQSNMMPFNLTPPNIPPPNIPPPNIPPPNIPPPNIPPPNIPQSHYERMQAVGGNHFQPPRYGGFEGFGLSTKNAALNWQRAGSVSSAAIHTEKCVHCDNHSNPSKDGLCNECFRQREDGQRQLQAEEICECVNDGCKGAGKECFSFLCEECYKKQIDALKPNEPQPPPQQLHNQGFNQLPPNYQGNVMDPRLAPGGFNPLQQPYQAVDGGNEINPGLRYPMGYPPQHMNLPQQQNQMQPLPVSYPFVSQQEPVHPFYPVNPPPFDPRYQNTGGQTINDTLPPIPQNPVAAGIIQQVDRQLCKGLSCEFYGSEEYGGYCSSCFLNITKVEAEKHNARPADGNVAATSPRCIGFQCQNYGSMQRQGYCTQCAQIYLP